MPSPVQTPPLCRVAITGARGRLAGCLRPYLAARQFQVTGLSRTETDGLLGMENLFLSQLPEQLDALIHTAWSTLPAFSERNIGFEWEQDLPFLFRLLRRLAESPNRDRLHFVFFSSGGTVYGVGDGQPLTEDSPCRPIGWYGQAKRAAEEIIESFAARHGLACAILRISNPYGFRVPVHRPQGIIPHAIACALQDRPFTLWGDGSAEKDFLHYTDFNRAIEAVLRHRFTGTYNICAGATTPVSRVLDCVATGTGRPLQIVSTAPAAWDVQHTRLSGAKFHAATGWRAEIPLADGIARCIREIGEPL